ncbi:MAG: conjugal transfer protein [Chloroflexi bacterium]|nr:MAG: conjugal transfer protein [Chloroflexota bacterium]
MIETQSVNSTLYLPLIGNIYTSRKFRELLFDEKALQLEKEVPLNISQKTGSEYFYLAAASRYYNMDLEIKSFIQKNQKCNVINIGAGLDTSYYRIKSGIATFYEIDLPPVIAERKRLIPEQENDIYISCSFLNVEEWANKIKDKDIPTLLIISGVFYYFKKEDIDKFFFQVKDKFVSSEAVFDCNSKKALSVSNTLVKRTGNENAPMYFYINDINSYLKHLNLDIKLIKEYQMYHYSRRILQRVSIMTRIMMFVSDLFKMFKVEHIKIN